MASTPPLPAFLATLPEFRTTQRIQSLYSDLARQQQSNPTGYTANLEWWRNTLQSVVQHGLQPTGQPNPDRLVLHVNQSLSDAFMWAKVGRPLGLSVVVSELTASASLVPLRPFLDSAKSIHDKGSVASRLTSALVVRPLSWALRQLSATGYDDQSKETTDARWKRVQGGYVALPVLKATADQFIEVHKGRVSLNLSESLFTPESFKKQVRTLLSLPLTDMDVQVLIRYLVRDRRVLLAEAQALKFIDTDSPQQELTSIDRGVLEMKSAIEKLDAQVEDLANKIASRTATIKSCLAKGRKEMAVAHLRSRKALEELLTQRLGSLANLNQALLSVDQAHSDATIVGAYEASSRVLKEILSKPELQTGRVEAVMASLAEGMEDTEELRQTVEIGQKQALEAAGATIDSATEEQIQMELEALVEEQKKQEAESAREEAVKQAEKETELAAQRILATLEAPNAALTSQQVVATPEAV